MNQLPTSERLVLTGDHTAWERLWAHTLAGRSYQHQPTPIPGRRPVTIGHGYATIAVIPEAQGGWALPLLHERIVNQTPVDKASQQLRRVCQQLAVRPITLWDTEYGCAAFLRATADLPADRLIRLRINLCLEGPPKPYQGRGPYPKHGVKFNFKDPLTWWQPDQAFQYQDPEFGWLMVRIWRGLRFRQALDCPMNVAQVERLQAPGTRRKPKMLWFAWVGEEPPAHWWSLYTRRYPIEHWYRFAKGRLHWTLPKLATAEQADRWSDLMPLITWELWQARSWVHDCPLPWQKPQTCLSPGRVCQSLQNILVAIGTPARVCKPRGKSPGWPLGCQRSPRERHELVRSERWRIIRDRQKANDLLQKPIRGRPKKIRDPVLA